LAGPASIGSLPEGTITWSKANRGIMTTITRITGNDTIKMGKDKITTKIQTSTIDDVDRTRLNCMQ
jgi:hypothetical protein